MLSWIALCVALCISAILHHLYRWRRKQLSFFKDRDIPGPEPHFIFGNLLELYRKGMLNATEGWASQYGDIVGYFHGFKPVMIVRDPLLIKQIFIRNFDSFTARHLLTEVSGVVPINTVRLSRVYGGNWRELRALTSPAFKSSKIKHGFPIIDECTEEFLQKLKKETEQKRGGVEISEPFCRLSMEILLRFTMGVQLNVQEATKDTEFLMNCARDSVGQFALSWIVFFNVIPLWRGVKHLIVFVRSCLFELPSSIFHNHITELVRLRRSKGTKGDEDLLQLMLDAEETVCAETKLNGTSHSTEKNGEANSYTPRRRLRITPFSTEANAGLFVVAGLETVASSLAFTAYLLAKHQDVQEKVRTEVKSLLKKDGSINFDNIFTLQYLNQVIAESLRFYPPLPGIVSRRCEKDFEFNGLSIPKDTNIQVPVRLMHHDPRYWSDPQEFNPDRFSPENKRTIEPMAYIPYGIGPRNCPASRFAELKLMLITAKTVANYKLHLSDETEKSSIKYIAPLVLAVADGGVWVRMQKI